MARVDRAKQVDPAHADMYAEVGRRLLLAGRAMLERGDARHAPALAIVSIHATIAFADAVCIHAAGKKSTSPDHEAAARLLRSVAGQRLPKPTERTLQRLLGEKNRLEYEGYVATMKEAQELLLRAERFAAWAEEVLLTRRAMR
ncbi:MAG: hypothetical protein HY337_04025 [Gemmatimonadetes bacterium]|nr:hypothetical protein [Gemmatimonadota bacterium]